VEPGSTVLGVEITERRFHTVYSLSAEVGIDRPRLSRLLKKIGHVPSDATEVEIGTMVFDAAEAVFLIEAFKTAVPLQDVPEYLGASKGQVEILYRSGIVKPLVPRTGRGSVRHVVFGRQHLDGLLRQLLAFTEMDADTCSVYHPIAVACQRGAGPFEDGSRRILAGQIPCFRNHEKSGIGSICVYVNAIVAAKRPA